MSDKKQNLDEYESIDFYRKNGETLQDGFSSFEMNGKHYFCLYVDGDIALISQAYKGKSGRDNGIQSVIKNSQIEDRFRYGVRNDGKEGFSLIAGNKQEIAVSGPQTSASQAKNLASRMRNKKFSATKMQSASRVKSKPTKIGSRSVRGDYKPLSFYETYVSGKRKGIETFKASNGLYYFTYNENGKIRLISEGYPSIQARNKGATSVRKNIADKRRFKRRNLKNGKYDYILKARNGQQIARSIWYGSATAAASGLNYLTGQRVRTTKLERNKPTRAKSRKASKILKSKVIKGKTSVKETPLKYRRIKESQAIPLPKTGRALRSQAKRNIWTPMPTAAEKPKASIETETTVAAAKLKKAKAKKSIAKKPKTAAKAKAATTAKTVTKPKTATKPKAAAKPKTTAPKKNTSIKKKVKTVKAKAPTPVKKKTVVKRVAKTSAATKPKTKVKSTTKKVAAAAVAATGIAAASKAVATQKTTKKTVKAKKVVAKTPVTKKATPKTVPTKKVKVVRPLAAKPATPKTVVRRVKAVPFAKPSAAAAAAATVAATTAKTVVKTAKPKPAVVKPVTPKPVAPAPTKPVVERVGKPVAAKPVAPAPVATPVTQPVAMAAAKPAAAAPVAAAVGGTGVAATTAGTVGGGLPKWLWWLLPLLLLLLLLLGLRQCQPALTAPAPVVVAPTPAPVEPAPVIEPVIPAEPEVIVEPEPIIEPEPIVEPEPIPVEPTPIEPETVLATPTTAICGPSDNPLFNAPSYVTPVNVIRLGTYPQFGNQHGNTTQSFYSNLNARYETREYDRQYLDFVARSIGYQSFKDVNASAVSDVRLTKGSKGVLGFGEFHGHTFSQLNVRDDRDLEAFAIQGANGQTIHFMKTCGNFMYVCQ